MKIKRRAKPVSVYFSPKALEIVEQYTKNSGFGSVSRTIEEMILAYDKSYDTLLNAFAIGGVDETLQNPAAIVILFINLINNLGNLNKGSPLEEILKQKMARVIAERLGIEG